MTASVVLLALLATQALAGPTNLVPRDTCTSGALTANGRSYTITCGQDRFGGDYANLLTSTWTGCVNACTTDTRCKSAQYNEQNGYCYLKSSANTPSSSQYVDSVDLDTATASACQAGKQTFSGLQCTVTCNQDRPGGDYGAAYTGTFSACANACATDKNCASAQFDEARGYCYFKSALNGAVPKAGVADVVCDRGSTTTTTTTTTSTTTLTTSTTTTTSASGLKPQGAYCNGNSQCQSGMCTKGYYCGPANNGSTCTQNSDCASNNCAKSTPGASFGTCQTSS